MARIRTIKPEFWKHESLCEQPEATHMLAAALINYADDHGYFNANPKLIAGEIYPLREPSVSIPESLRRLQAIGYIRLGTGADGRAYGHIVEFDKHQRVSHPTDSKISCLTITWHDSGIIPEASVKAPETFGPEQGTGNREGNGTGKGYMPADAGGSVRKNLEEGFEEFHSAFKPPKNSRRPDALREWIATTKTRPPLPDLLRAVAGYNSWLAEEWRKNKREFPSKQHAATWLRGEVWESFTAKAPDMDPAELAALMDRTDRRLQRGKYAPNYGGTA